MNAFKPSSRRKVLPQAPRVLAAFLMIFLTSCPTFAQSTALHPEITFTDVTQQAGLSRVSYEWAPVFVDFDGDGWLDLHVINRRYEPSALYRNLGDGAFADVTEQSGLRVKTHDGFAIWADFDNDGDKDCLVAGLSQDELFFNNGDGVFTSLGGLFGRAGTGRLGKVAVADFDRDGLLDLFVCQTDNSAQPHEKDRGLLFKNLGGGKFEEIGTSAGFAELYDAFDAAAADIDRDGWPDIIVSGMQPPSLRVFANRGGRKFVEVTDESFSTTPGIQKLPPYLICADLDGDGWQDVVAARDSVRVFRNRNGVFSLQKQTGLESYQVITALAASDVDADGWLDLFFVHSGNKMEGFRGAPEKQFSPITTLSSLTKTGSFNTGVAFGDFDRDGDPDIYVTNKGVSGALYRNEQREKNYLKLNLTGRTANRDGVGAKIEVFAASWKRSVDAGLSFTSGSAASGEASCGLGPHTKVDSVVIYWPGDSRQVKTKIAANADRTLALVEPAAAQFEEISVAAGISGKGISRGAVFFDYDNDGWLDLVVNSRMNFCYRNLGNGAFEDNSATSGVTTAREDGGGVAAGDFNNDGVLDLLMTTEGNRPHRLLPGNENGAFENRSYEAGMITGGRGGPVLLADFDGNGFLDAMLPGTKPVQLFFNRGNLAFSEKAQDSGFHNLIYRQHLTGCTGDYDNDGDIDIYLANSSWSSKKQNAPNYLFRNRGDGTFEDVTEAAGAADSSNSKAAIFGDFNNDGWLDLLVANDGWPNRLFRNNSDGTFTDVAPRAGVTAPFAASSANLADFDNDGDLDLYFGGGSYLPEDSLVLAFKPQPDFLYRNDGDRGNGIWTFTEITAEAGISNPANCAGTTWGDIDNDGDLDFFVVNALDVRDRPVSDNLINNPPYPQDQLYRNHGNLNHFVQIKLVGYSSNKAAIGARVEAYAEGLFQIREVQGGAGMGSQNSLRAAFGLGQRSRIDRLVIRWPGGIVQIIHNPPIDQILTIEEPTRLVFVLIERATLRRARQLAPWFGGLALVVIFGFIYRALPKRRRRAQGKKPATLRQKSEQAAPPDEEIQSEETLDIHIELEAFKGDYLLYYHVDHVEELNLAGAIEMNGSQKVGPYELRSQKIRQIQEDFAEISAAYMAYIQNGRRQKPAPAELLRETGERLHDFFGLRSLFEMLFSLEQSRIPHLRFLVNDFQIPWHYAFDSARSCFLLEKFAYSFLPENMAASRPAHLEQQTAARREKTAILLCGDQCSQARALPEAAKEIDDAARLLEKAGVRTQSVYSNAQKCVETLLRAQKQNEYLRLIHFCGHIDNDSLNIDENEYLNPALLKQSYGIAFPSAPLVFLNGCSSGTIKNPWDPLANLATGFLACGASACIVTDFLIPETTGSKFAAKFYRRFVGEGNTAGEALRLARLDLGQEQIAGKSDAAYDITRYFYNLYGDPTMIF